MEQVDSNPEWSIVPVEACDVTTITTNNKGKKKKHGDMNEANLVKKQKAHWDDFKRYQKIDKFKDGPLVYEDSLDLLFKRSVATGGDVFIPSALENNEEDLTPEDIMNDL